MTQTSKTDQQIAEELLIVFTDQQCKPWREIMEPVSRILAEVRQQEREAIVREIPMPGSVEDAIRTRKETL